MILKIWWKKKNEKFPKDVNIQEDLIGSEWGCVLHPAVLYKPHYIPSSKIFHTAVERVLGLSKCLGKESWGKRWEKWLFSSSDSSVTGWKDTNGRHRRIKETFSKTRIILVFPAWSRVSVGASAGAGTLQSGLGREGGREIEDAQDPGVSLLQPLPKGEWDGLSIILREWISSPCSLRAEIQATPNLPHMFLQKVQVSAIKWVCSKKKIQRFAVDFSLTEAPLVNCLKTSSPWLQFISLTNPWGHDSTKQ